jgi:hypothetical protein
MGTNATMVRAMDMNGDGNLDLISADTGGSVSVRINTTPVASPDLSFATRFFFIVGTTPRGIAIGDVNGDGKPDIVCANGGSSTVSVLLNTTPLNSTTPSFAAVANFATDTNPYFVELADINGDGKLDIVAPCFDGNSVVVLLNNTTAFATTLAFLAKKSFAVTSHPDCVSVADIDGDGKPDIACSNDGSSNVATLLNTTAAQATIPTFQLLPR